MQVAVIHASSVAADPALLSCAERGALSSVRGERRRDEWIRGRLAIRRVLGDPETSVLVAADGAPCPVGGAPRSVSLSHDGEWIAVATADGRTRVGIDLCLRLHAARVAKILRWLDVRAAIDALAAWTALEAALKLRRLPIEALRDRDLHVSAAAEADAVIVHGLGAAVTAHVQHAADYVVGWAQEAA